MGYLRGDDGRNLGPPSALVDAWLLEAFPGRTLDELDAMNWPRYLRAREAQNVESVEKARQLQISGKLKAEDLQPETWESIKRHDQLLAAQARQHSTPTQ